MGWGPSLPLCKQILKPGALRAFPTLPCTRHSPALTPTGLEARQSSFLSSLLPLATLYNAPFSPAFLEAASLAVYTAQEESVYIILEFVSSTEQVAVALPWWLCLCLLRGPAALLPGCWRAAGYAELLPSRSPAQL